MGISSNLGILNNPASSPDVQPAAEQSPQNGTAPAAAANPVNQPHAGLRSMLEGLFLGLDSFAKAAATGGREGGVTEVQDYHLKQKQAQLAQDAAEREKQESAERIKHTQALTNSTIAQTQILMHNAPAEYQKLVMGNQKALADFLINDLHIPPAFAVPMMQGQGTDEHIAAINSKSGGDLVNNTVVPAHDDSFGGKGTSYGFSFDKLKQTNLTQEQASPTLANLQSQIELAKGILGADDQTVRVAQGRLDLFKQASAVNGWDFYNFNQQMQAQLMSKVANKEAVTKFQGEQATIKGKQQENDPLFKLENDPGQMAGEKAAAAIPLLQNKITSPQTSPEDKVRATRLLAQAKAAHQGYLNDVASKAHAEQAAKQGDPAAAGKLLANGDLTLADLKTRGVTPKFISDVIQSAKTIDPKYNPADENIAEQVAKSPQANQFFGSANSLLAKGGTLDQVVQQGEKLPDLKLPVFNKVADVVSYASGHKEVQSYLMTSLGAADDYAKVVGGGQPSEHMQMLIFNKLTAADNQNTRKGVVDAMKQSVNSQVTERIGKNKFLNRMYGYALPQNQKADTFDPSKLPDAK